MQDWFWFQYYMILPPSLGKILGAVMISSSSATAARLSGLISKLGSSDPHFFRIAATSICGVRDEIRL